RSLIGLADQLGKNLRAIRWLQSRLRGRPAELAGDELNEVATFFFKKIQRESLELRSDPEQFRQVVQHYRESIRYMVQQASRRDVTVLLLTVPVNLRDWLPTVSHNRQTGTQRENWEKLYRQARKHLLASQFDDGIRTIADAIAIEPDHAESYFWLGQMQKATGNTTEALESYRRAKDLDYNPFRAHSLFNEALREIAREYPHVTLVDLAKAFPSSSASGLPGFDLFLDYVHPNKQGNLLIAQKVFGALLQQDIGGGKAATSEFIRSDKPVPGTGRPYNELTHIQLQTRLFNLYAQNHQYDAAVRKAIHLHRLVTGKDEEPEKLHPQLSEKVREGYQVFRRYLNWQRKDLLGQLQADNEKQQAESHRREFFEKWYPYGTF
ncbi:MAG: hypothetical protein QGH33_17590, partial [Pirellulaceae bacterium]|nr:hypothetical protein [Pirellulaceae bacterium]